MTTVPNATWQNFRHFIQWVQQTYPLLQQQLELTPVNELTLLYRWKGQDSNKAAVLLSAHYDVVPVTPGTEKLWQQAPFSGAIADGFVWGRGAMDDKGAAVSMLEAITLLLQQGFQPPHDVYLALTHDEEIGSSEGAAAVSTLLQQRKVNLAWSLDEGSFVLRQMVPGVAADVASINVAEKGFLNLQLTVQSPRWSQLDAAGANCRQYSGPCTNPADRSTGCRWYRWPHPLTFMINWGRIWLG